MSRKNRLELMRSRRGTQYDQGPRAAVGRTAPAYFEGFGKHVFLKPPERRKKLFNY